MKEEKNTALTLRESSDPSTGNEKLTIYEYEQRYVKRQNVRGAKFFLRFFAAFIGVFLFALLALTALRVYEINEYAGYAVAGICLLLYVFLFLVPMIKIFKSDYFVTNVNAYSARNAQKHNRKLRHDIAEKMIDFTAKVEGVGWYDSEVVGRLAMALKVGDEEKLRACLTELYNKSVKKSAKDLIFKSALKSATYSAVSQAKGVDAALVIVVNMQLIKDIIFLYGFRPSDAKLAKIFARVLQNSLVAYGLGGVNLGNSVVKTMGNAVRDIPLLGSAIAAVVDSSVQGLVNGTLTTVIGYQTIRYLNKEYRLQDILDGVDVSGTPVELEETCTELEAQLKKKKKLAHAV